MNYFFVRDHRHRHRFFSAEPLGPMPAHFSRTREIWEKAKRKVTGLNPRTLLQEQAFEHGGRPGPLRILHAGRYDDKAVRTRFIFFLRRLKTRHVLVLAAEAAALPVAGLAAFLPGPNIIFYFLAIVMIIQWQAWRGITRIIRKEHEFVADPVLEEWEAAVDAGDEARFPELLERLEKTHGLPSPRKLLWG